MTAVDQIQINNPDLKLSFKVTNNNEAEKQISEQIKNDRYENSDSKAKDITYQNIGDGMSRPIKIDSSNSIFYINHNAQNKSIKIEAGEYNLQELQAALQKKVNEKFGINKLSLKLTAAGKDRLIYAEDKKEIPEIDLKA